MFGGTSAASAIAAGVAALVAAAAKKKNKPCDGPSIKRILKETCVYDFDNGHNGAGRKKLIPDKMNEEARADPAFVFGSGLLNVSKALALAGD
jgi:hypothetical protein